jgi:hypothetical protein
MAATVAAMALNLVTGGSMRRVVVFALIFAFGSTAAFAEDTIAQAGMRALQSQLAASTSTARSAGSLTSVPALHARVLQPPVAKAMQQEVPVLSKSGMSGRKKALLYASLAAAFVASAWVIDHKVQDITPSSLGTRQD